MLYYYDDSKSSRVILRISGNVVTSFTENPENADYQAYLAWVAEGNSPLPWPPVS